MKDLKMYINGKFVESRSGKWIEVLNPSTEEVISRQPEGTVEDVEEATQQRLHKRNGRRHLPLSVQSISRNSRREYATDRKSSWKSSCESRARHVLGQL